MGRPTGKAIVKWIAEALAVALLFGFLAYMIAAVSFSMGTVFWPELIIFGVTINAFWLRLRYSKLNPWKRDKGQR